MPLRWGILGAGNISGQFVHDLIHSNTNNRNTHIVASIGSSSVEKGRQFLQKHGVKAENNQGVEATSQTYDDFFKNPDIDAVYVGTPHSFHHEQVLRALNSGKHVLCEKPITVTGEQAKELFAVAKEKRLFLMEAVWTRFFPVVEKAIQLLYKDKVLGEVHRLHADFSMDMDLPALAPESRTRNIDLAGGATLDIGIYPLTYCRALLCGPNGTQMAVKSFLTVDETDKVDHVGTYIVKCTDGKQAVLTCSNHIDGPSPFLRVECAGGVLQMYAKNPAQPRSLRVVFKDKSKADIEFDDDIVTSGYNGFIYEADAVAKSIEAGETQNSKMPWEESQLMMDTMDQIRWENDFYYKNERK